MYTKKGNSRTCTYLVGAQTITGSIDIMDVETGTKVTSLARSFSGHVSIFFFASPPPLLPSPRSFVFLKYNIGISRV
jgi:hypothetical protein